MEVFLDGDFPVEGSKCKYHCSPTCHPGQIDPEEWHYGCLYYNGWPGYQEGDWCPFVKCGGDPEKCEAPNKITLNPKGETMKCFYHSSDLDGHCSGAIIKREFIDCEMYPINYGEPFPWDDIQPDDIVYMVDFSLHPFDDMLKLNEMCFLIWIDHHKTALTAHEGAIKELKGLRRNGIGACQLVWELLYGDRKVPYGIQLLAEYDVWNHLNRDTLPFQWGLRTYDTNPENQILWDRLIDNRGFVSRVVNEGKTILKYVNQYNEKYAKAASFETELDGLRCIAINKGMANSQLFDSVWDATKYDAMLSFCWYKDKWTVSLYSDREDVDVSDIAKGRGGGGHKGAAGFQCQELPFRMKLG